MRLYRIEILQQPETVRVPVVWEPHVLVGFTRLADDELHAQWVDEFGADKEYFNPSENKLYRSRSSARDKVKIVERWGGKARILEAEVSEFIPVEEANKRRRIKCDLERIKKLEDKIMHIKFTSEIEDLPLMDGDL
jgi:hypothetical protein